ncbi:MAG: purine-binding chemotaxis protein CheW [Cyclobacteriaceae bacterium]|nr:purine-binding chemotaxis protein CheW [Cyclobacteriaceae bacterium]
MKNQSHAYLTFALGDEKFAINVDHVQEVVEFDQLTKVPNAPSYMLGIINLRGQVLPLLDTKLKLGLPASERTSRSRIMVLDIAGTDDKTIQLGAMVDVAREVVEIADAQIQPAPELDGLQSTAPITGIVNTHGDITMIMDISKVFSVQDIVELNRPIN